jgi:outer membrane receptor protein involved in Fe transport
MDAIAYVQRYRLALFSNFTYFLRDPTNADQFEQADQRWIYGGSVTKIWATPMLGFTLTSGAEARYDDIGKVGLYFTKRRQMLSNVRQDQVHEYSAAAYTEATRTLGPIWVTGGLRLDTIGGEVRSNDPRKSGNASETFVSPKFTTAWRVSSAMELYADAGQGFHSNDIRGATITVAPRTEDPVTRVGPSPNLPEVNWGHATVLGALPPRQPYGRCI